jgi:hypothetical protein
MSNGDDGQRWRERAAMAARGSRAGGDETSKAELHGISEDGAHELRGKDDSGWA